jgi:hypothetical protein
VEVVLIHADRRTDRHDMGNRCFAAIRRTLRSYYRAYKRSTPHFKDRTTNRHTYHSFIARHKQAHFPLFSLRLTFFLEANLRASNPIQYGNQPTHYTSTTTDRLNTNQQNCTPYYSVFFKILWFLKILKKSLLFIALERTSSRTELPTPSL